MVRATLPSALALKVVDAANSPMAGLIVTFAVTLGGGSLSNPSGPTDGSGLTTVQWTLGTTPGQLQRLPRCSRVRPRAYRRVPGTVRPGGANATTGADGVATVGSWTVQLGVNTLTATPRGSGITGNPVTLAATGVSAAYHIDVRYLTGVTPAQRAAFDSAAAQWERLIYGDVPDEFASFPAGTCGPGSPAINETIDDIIIYVRLDSIDGPGKILGQAGPCLIRDPGFQPGVGVMRFDTADVAGLLAAGQFDEVVRHEMGHVLGFGTIWQSLGVLSGAGGTDPHFVGAQSTAAFDHNGGQAYSAGAKVPVENCCGPGTRDFHWRETVFATELMTGFLNGGVPNPLSVITTASMGDLGYLVNYAGSDPYTVPNAAALRAQASLPQIELGDDILRLPILVVDRRGRVTRIIRPK